MCLAKRKAAGRRIFRILDYWRCTRIRPPVGIISKVTPVTGHGESTELQMRQVQKFRCISIIKFVEVWQFLRVQGNYMRGWLSSTLRPTFEFHDKSARNFSQNCESAQQELFVDTDGIIAWVWIDDDDNLWKKDITLQCIQSFWIYANSIYRWNCGRLTKSDTSATEETHGHLKTISNDSNFVNLRQWCQKNVFAYW